MNCVVMFYAEGISELITRNCPDISSALEHSHGQAQLAAIAMHLSAHTSILCSIHVPNKVFIIII